MLETISKTDLARRTRDVIDQARRNGAVMVESYGVEQVVVVDAADYRLLRAAIDHQSTRPSSELVREPSMAPRGLSQEDVDQAVSIAGGDEQAAWDRILGAYWDLDISLGRAAELLRMSRFELHDRLVRLGLPILSGPESRAEARHESATY
jgi:prevent-host-death family protein